MHNNENGEQKLSEAKELLTVKPRVSYINLYSIIAFRESRQGYYGLQFSSSLHNLVIPINANA